MVNRELAAAQEGLARIRALGRNHSLWSILVKDLAMSDNRLPDPLKAELIGLALWSMHYSTMAMTQKLPTQPLIEVNQNVSDGLLGQRRIGGHNAEIILKASLSI